MCPSAHGSRVTLAYADVVCIRKTPQDDDVHLNVVATRSQPPDAQPAHVQAPMKDQRDGRWLVD